MAFGLERQPVSDRFIPRPQDREAQLRQERGKLLEQTCYRVAETAIKNDSEIHVVRETLSIQSPNLGKVDVTLDTQDKGSPLGPQPVEIEWFDTRTTPEYTERIKHDLIVEPDGNCSAIDQVLEREVTELVVDGHLNAEALEFDHAPKVHPAPLSVIDKLNEAIGKGTLQPLARLG